MKRSDECGTPRYVAKIVWVFMLLILNKTSSGELRQSIIRYCNKQRI